MNSLFYINVNNNLCLLFKRNIRYMSGYHIQFLYACLVIFLRVIFIETWHFSNYHTTSRTYTAGFLSSFMCWTNSTPSWCQCFFFSFSGTYTILYFLGPLCRWSAGSLSGCCWRGGGGVGAVDVKAGDLSSALSFSPSFSCGCYFINTACMKTLKAQPVPFIYWFVLNVLNSVELVTL